MSADFSLAELLVVAASEAWRGNGEVLASGIGVVPRLGAGLAKLTHSPELMMTDAEAHLVEEPVPLGARGDYVPKFSGYMSFARVFDCVWGGRRHVMIGPIQIDRFGQTNLSGIGDPFRPKVQMLGMRGLPGNSISHMNSMFVPNHGPRVFVAGEVDVVGGVGYNPARWPKGVSARHVDLRLIVTDLCVLDFGGTNHAIRVRSLHPGVSLEQVQAATGFPLEAEASVPTTTGPSAEQLAIITKLDPHGMRAAVIKGNPSAFAPRTPAKAS
jgi:glutaconate CoA-transferase subunit B